MAIDETEKTAIGYANTAEMRLQKEGIGSEFELDGDSDEEVALLYFTFKTDDTDKEYLSLPNSAFYVNKNGMVDEFDIRIGDVEMDIVEQAVSELPRQFEYYPEQTDTGQGGELIPHVRNRHCSYPIADFIQFLSQLLNNVNRLSNR